MNKKEIVNSERTKLYQKRTNAMLKVEKLLNTLMQDETFAKLEHEERAKLLEIVKTPIGTEQEKKLRKEQEKIIKQKEKRMAELGYSPADLLPKFECSECEDTGFVNNTMCNCLKISVRNRLKKESGLTSTINHSFKDSNEQILNSNETLAKAHKVAKEYVNNFPGSNIKNMVFVGNVGKGKTFLAECIANELINKNFYVVYLTSFELNNLMIKTMDLFNESREELLSPLLECDLLIIDDLGTEPVYKNFSIDNLYTIINQRQIHNLCTIISTNLSPQQVRDQYGDRLFSRIFNKQNTLALKFDGADLRIKK